MGYIWKFTCGSPLVSIFALSSSFDISNIIRSDIVHSLFSNNTKINIAARALWENTKYNINIELKDMFYEEQTSISIRPGGIQNGSSFVKVRGDRVGVLFCESKWGRGRLIQLMNAFLSI